MSCAPSQHTLTKDASLPFDAGRKLGIVEMALVWKVLQEDPQCPGSGGREKVPQVGSR